MYHRFHTPIIVSVLAILAMITLRVSTARADIIDSYDDGNFTTNPAWGGDVGSWTVVTSSDAASGAAGSNTLRLNVATGAGTQYLSIQRTADWGTSQSWSFWIGRRGQSATSTNRVGIVLYANEANLESATVDGYAISFGDNTGSDELQLVYFNNGISGITTVITSSDAIANNMVDYGFMVRVTRTAAGIWSLYTSPLPTANGTGAIATDEPSATNTPILQGSDIHSGITSFAGGYLGIVAVHSSGAAARAGLEFDQFFFAPSSDSPLPVELNDFSITADGPRVTLNWRTASEVGNAGFEIMRAPASQHDFRTIVSYLTDADLAGLGTSATGRTYSYTDDGGDLKPGRSYLYRLITIDEDGTRHEHPAREVMIDDGPVSPTEAFSIVIAPNPTAGDLRMRYSADDPLRLMIYSATGEAIAGIATDRTYPAGSGEVTIATGGLPTGIYTLRLASGLRIITRRVVIVR